MKRKKFFALTAILSAVALTVCGCDLNASIADNDPANTETVYEVAQSLGFDGTESEWVASLFGNGSVAEEDPPTSSVQDALASTVSVWCTFTERSAGSSSTVTMGSTGSGVIYRLDAQNGSADVITNYHVIYDGNSIGNEKIAHVSDNINLFLYGNETENKKIPATFVGGSKEYDVAVLRVENHALLKDEDLRAIYAADSDAVAIGDPVYAVGNPEGKGISVSRGVVSVDAEYISVASVTDEATAVKRLVLRTDASVNHGNSGGGLFDAEGKLVGIVNARSEDDDVYGMGYAIPANLVLAITQNILDNEPSSCRGALCAMMGVTTNLSDSTAVREPGTGIWRKIETVTVTGVSGMSVGKLQNGDVIYSMQITHNGKEGEEVLITREYMIKNVLFNVRKGDEVTVRVSRGGSIVSAKLSYAGLTNLTGFKLYD
ncbi:MAG: S1C family serine protease [Candidatus Gallimonas sp.]